MSVQDDKGEINTNLEAPHAQASRQKSKAPYGLEIKLRPS